MPYVQIFFDDLIANFEKSFKYQIDLKSLRFSLLLLKATRRLFFLFLYISLSSFVLVSAIFTSILYYTINSDDPFDIIFLAICLVGISSLFILMALIQEKRWLSYFGIRKRINDIIYFVEDE